MIIIENIVENDHMMEGHNLPDTIPSILPFKCNYKPYYWYNMQILDMI
jgi:hypothetical protein